MKHDLHFRVFTCHKNSEFFFSLALSFEAISIDELGLTAPYLHTYATIIMLKFIFHKKFQMEVGYCFFFYLVYINDDSFSN